MYFIYVYNNIHKNLIICRYFCTNLELWRLKRCLNAKLNSSGREAQNRAVEIERLRRVKIRLANFCPATRRALRCRLLIHFINFFSFFVIIRSEQNRKRRVFDARRVKDIISSHPCRSWMSSFVFLRISFPPRERICFFIKLSFLY